MTRFNQCPNCGHKGYFTVYACKKCDTCYCYVCGEERCPNCGSKERTEAGMAYD